MVAMDSSDGGRVNLLFLANWINTTATTTMTDASCCCCCWCCECPVAAAALFCPASLPPIVYLSRWCFLGKSGYWSGPSWLWPSAVVSRGRQWISSAPWISRDRWCLGDLPFTRHDVCFLSPFTPIRRLLKTGSASLTSGGIYIWPWFMLAASIRFEDYCTLTGIFVNGICRITVSLSTLKMFSKIKFQSFCLGMLIENRKSGFRF